MVLIMTNGPTCYAMALTGPIEGDAETFLGDHAHKMLGPWPSLEKAMHACDAYGAKWLKTEKRVTKKCGCTEIK